MSPSSRGAHEDVAAYALGVLDEEDHQAFERHLMSCEECQAELRELSEVPGLLDAVRKDRSNSLTGSSDDDRASH
ncbi:zf-HC2 domain-containing protein [Planomonospora sp. ID67723]|uniref:zf-HC2 domain-containing protein n=1 Tax=Planomonospora sp. ID67723 TaxID=2738134 RepID=UPI0018C40646|nr:zf-HC2 domain-containing protein [Planomonospora sp. ID67723]MBG0829147.1 zf-HC2 domain-containing protein [Planomonospora sp. ID67723]